MEDARPEKSRVIKNLLVLIISRNCFMMVNSPTRQLQSSLYIVDGVGTKSNSVGDAFKIVSCLLLPPALARGVGHKRCILLGFAVEIVHVAANLHPTFASLTAAKVVASLLTDVSHASNFTMLSILVRRYVHLHGGSVSKTMALIFGVNAGMKHAASALGNLISYVVLDRGLKSVANSSSGAEMTFRNKCGIAFVASEHEDGGNFQPPPIKYSYILFGTFIGVIGVNLLVCACCLDEPDTATDGDETRSWRDTFELFFATLTLHRDWRTSCLFLTSLHVRLLWVFRTADVNNAFVTCLLGMQYVALAALIKSLVSMTSSYLMTFAMKFTKRVPIFAFALLVESLFLLSALFWTPTRSTNDYLNVFVMTSLEGVVAPGFNIGLHVLHAELFPTKTEASFANYLLASDLGSMIGNAYSGSLRLSVEVYILLALMLVSTTSLFAVEISIRIAARNEENEKKALLSLPPPTVR